MTSLRAPSVYRLLIRLFPSAFRDDYAQHMETLFAQMLSIRPRRRDRLILWCRAIMDIVVHAFAERVAQWRDLFQSPRPSGSRERKRMHVINDFRYAARGFLRNPGFAVAFILTLGLGIGANTAIFSVINGVLLQPLPYHDGDRVVSLRQPVTQAKIRNITFSVPEIIDLRNESQTLRGFAEYSSWVFTVLGRGEPHRVETAVVSANYFDVVGLEVQHGRAFIPADDDLGAEPVAILTQEYWTQVFAADPGAVGQTLNVDGTLLTIAGVLEMTPEYAGTRDIYINTTGSDHHRSAMMTHNRTHRMTQVFARLAPGATVEEAQTELTHLKDRLHAAYPEAYPEEQGYDMAVALLRDEITREARPTLLILLCTAGFVLIIACANVANLTLTRVIRREREFAVRAALGAGSGRLRRQLLTESLILSLAGAGLGLVFAVLGLDVLVAYVARFTSRAAEIRIDNLVLLFALVVATGSAIFFAWVPGLPTSRDLGTSLTEGGGRSTGGMLRRRMQRALVVSQLAVSFVLLIGAGLLLRSLISMHRVDPGFDPENVLTMDVPNQGRSHDQRRAFYAAALEQIEQHPGVRSAAVAMTVPLRSSPMVHDFRIDGREVDAGTAPQADFKSVSPGYFGTVGLPLLGGRTFTNLDHENAPPVVVVNESMANFYFPNEDPIGNRVAWNMGGAMGGPDQWRSIVGVVGDSKEYGLDRDIVHGVFQPFAQEPFAATVLIRTTSNPAQLIPQAVQAIRTLAPNQPVDNIRTLLQLRSDSIAPRRLNATLFGTFAVLALVIAAVGVSGVLAFSVSQRTHEFGIRLTLGADQNRVLGMVLREGATLAAVGLGIGAVGALSLSRFLARLLFDVQATDPLTFVGVGVALVGVAILASYIPARRATRVDPMEALRSE